MLRDKQKQISLPPIQGSYGQIAKLSAYQPNPHTDNALRSKTQSFKSKNRRAVFLGSQLFQNISQVQQFQLNRYNLDREKDKLDKSNKQEQISQIIDTRKSIKMLLNYFGSKSQEQKNKNSNCYHSPKKKVCQLLPLVNTPDRNIIGMKAINLKKIKLKQKKMQIKTQGNESAVKHKKYRRYHMKDVIKIQALPVDTLQKSRKNNFSAYVKGQKDHKQKINSHSDSKEVQSVMKIKSKDQILHVQRKVTEFQGWHIENDNNYFQ